MLTQLFLARYPTGNLLSELVEIYQGKFVVQVAVQIDGTTRVTSMAAAETVEIAEDQARERALGVLMPQSASALTQPWQHSPVDTESQQPAESKPAIPELVDDRIALATNTVTNELEPKDSDVSDFSTQSDQDWSNVTPMRSPSPMLVETADDPIGSAPIDLSDALLKIDVLLKRLGWSSDHESEYLERTYKKRSRQFLTETEIVEFENYLELLAKTGDEMKRLKWSMQQGRDYLLQTYNKRKRTSLTHQELLEFLEYLESQPSFSTLT